MGARAAFFKSTHDAFVGIAAVVLHVLSFPGAHWPLSMGNICCGKKAKAAAEAAVLRRAALQALDQREHAMFDLIRHREQNIAATLLQTLCRGALQCPQIGRHEWMHQGPPDGSRYRTLGVKRKINTAAQTLGQQLMLGYAVRCRFEKAIYSAIYMERVWRGHKQRSRLRFLNAMALKIQTSWRGWHWRRWLKDMKINLMANALQHAARVHMAKLALIERRRFRAALTIQWFWRRRAKMRIWMAIRYMKAAARIQGGFRGMQQRQARLKAYNSTRRKTKEFLERVGMERHMGTFDRLRISYEEMLTLRLPNLEGLRSDAALGGQVGRNRGMHIHKYDAKMLARHIKAERTLYAKSQANKRKWALIRAKPAAATRIQKTFRGHCVRLSRLAAYQEQPGKAELQSLLQKASLPSPGAKRALLAHFERRRITRAMLAEIAEGDQVWKIGGQIDPAVDWGWVPKADKTVGGKLVVGSPWMPSHKSGKIQWGLEFAAREQLFKKMRLTQRMALAKKALAEQRRKEAEALVAKQAAEAALREERRLEKIAYEERIAREAAAKAAAARQQALWVMQWRERERAEAAKIAAEKEDERAKKQQMIANQEGARHGVEAQRRAELESERRVALEAEAAAAEQAEMALEARLGAVSTLRRGRTATLQGSAELGAALAVSASTGRVIYPQPEVEGGWPSKMPHAGARGLVVEVDTSDQTVLLRLPAESNPLRRAAQVAEAIGRLRQVEVWFPVEALDMHEAEGDRQTKRQQRRPLRARQGLGAVRTEGRSEEEEKGAAQKTSFS